MLAFRSEVRRDGFDSWQIEGFDKRISGHDNEEPKTARLIDVSTVPTGRVASEEQLQTSSQPVLPRRTQEVGGPLVERQLVDDMPVMSWPAAVDSLSLKSLVKNRPILNAYAYRAYDNLRFEMTK